MNDSIRPGEVWKDTDGNPIQAHGFSVFYNEKDGLYYWYGENKEKTKEVPSIRYGTGASGAIRRRICTTGRTEG